MYENKSKKDDCLFGSMKCSELETRERLHENLLSIHQRTMVKRTLCNGETTLSYWMRSVSFSSLELHPGVFLLMERMTGVHLFSCR